MPRGAGSARKRGDSDKPFGRIPAAIWRPESGRHLAAGIRPPVIIHYIGRNPAPKLRPESGRQIGAIFEAILNQFGGAAVAQWLLNFFAQWGPLCERTQVDFRFDLPPKLANKGRLLQRPQTVL